MSVSGMRLCSYLFAHANYSHMCVLHMWECSYQIIMCKILISGQLQVHIKCYYKLGGIVGYCIPVISTLSF